MEEPKLANNSEKFTSIPSWLPAGQNFRQNELEFFFEMLNVSIWCRPGFLTLEQKSPFNLIVKKFKILLTSVTLIETYQFKDFPVQNTFLDL